MCFSFNHLRWEIIQCSTECCSPEIIYDYYSSYKMKLKLNDYNNNDENVPLVT